MSVFDYPFAALVEVSDAAPAGGLGALRFVPNPFSSTVRITATGGAPRAGLEAGTLEVYDLSGRRVRRIAGNPAAGFVWDGRDDRGRSLPAGVYLHRVSTPRGATWGRSCLVR